MKHLSFLIALLLISVASFSQPWLRNLPDKPASDLTLFDYQQAFERYWAPYNVADGYYYEDGIKKKASGWKQFKRWEYEMESKVDPVTGEFPKRSAQEIYEEYLQQNGDMLNPVSASWTSLGPDNSTGGYAGIGRLNVVAFHPSDNNTYWVGAASGGLWKTTNNGTSWTCLTDNNGILAISDIIINPDYATSGIIYIATGDRDHWDNRSIGVLKSTNGGTSWNTTGITYNIQDSKMVYRLLQDPTNSLVLYAATSNGVYKTTDGGTTWGNQLTTLGFIDMEFKPGTPSTMYGSTTGGKIYVSTNSGVSWTQTLSDAQNGRVELAVSANQPAWVYAVAVASNSGLSAIYKSTNSGTSFTSVFSGSTLNLLGWNANGGDAGGQGWYDLALAASPTDANTLLVGGVNTWRSTNGGTSWSIVNHWWGDGVPAVHADKHNLRFRNGGDLFEVNDGGVYISPNNGTSWTDKTNGIVISQMYKLGVSQSVTNESITGLQDNGTKILSAGLWDDVIGGDGMECLIDYTDNNVQYGEVYYGDIKRTINHWVSSSSIKPSGAGSGAWVTPFIIDPVNNQALYSGYADVYYSTNRGTSWTKISTFGVASTLRSMAIAPSNTQHVFAAFTNQLWKTTNGGGSWTNITGSLPVGSGSITSIAVKQDDPLTIWVTLGGYNTNTVYRSTDGGTTWTNLSAGLPQIPCYSIVQNKQSLNIVHLYVATEVGVFFKKGTDNWIPFNTGLPNVKLGEIEIWYSATPQNSKLRAATFGRGLWESPVEPFCVNPPVPTIAGPANSCQGSGGVTYTTEPGMTNYAWTVSAGGTITGGSGTNQITVTWNMVGPQSVSVNYTDANLCTALVPTVLNVTVNPIPLAIITQVGPSTFCQGGSVTLESSPANSYLWSNGATTQSIIVTTSGSYTVTVTDLAGCSATSAPVVVTVNPNPVANAGNDQTINYGSSTTLTGSATSGTGTYTWHWEPASLLINPNIQNPLTTNLTTTTIFTLTTTDAMGCVGSDQVMVSITGGPLSVDATATPATVCPGEAVQLMAVTSGGTGSNIYSWTSNPPGFMSGLPNPVANPVINTTYTVTVNDGISIQSDSVSVEVLEIPVVPQTPAGPDTVDVKFILQSDYQTVAVSGATSYEWALEPITAGSIGGTGTTATVVWSDEYSGIAEITVRAVNTCGSSAWSDAKSTLVMNTATGISSLNNAAEILIYPNPAQDKLTIEFPAGVKQLPSYLEIYEVQGKKVMHAGITERKLTMDISPLVPGVYLIRTASGGVYRLVKSPF